MKESYTVFIDESFGEGFTVLARNEAYFCYSALMVPERKLGELERFWNANCKRLIEKYRLATGFQIQGEFKSGYLNKLPFAVRRQFGERLAYFLCKNQCFVAGFYTNVENTLAYRHRTEVAKADDAKVLPQDWRSELLRVKESLLADKPQNPGDAYLLLSLFYQTVCITLNFLGSAGAEFQVVYDPRQKKEDRFLLRHSDELLRMVEQVNLMKGAFKGATAAVDSSRSPGLMLVDLILRDVRLLFTEVPELLSDQSGTALVLPGYQGFDPVVAKLAGVPMKWGDRRPMNEGLRRRLSLATEGSMLPLYFDRLADGKLSCEANHGESRVLNFGLWCMEDMID